MLLLYICLSVCLSYLHDCVLQGLLQAEFLLFLCLGPVRVALSVLLTNWSATTLNPKPYGHVECI